MWEPRTIQHSQIHSIFTTCIFTTNVEQGNASTWQEVGQELGSKWFGPYCLVITCIIKLLDNAWEVLVLHDLKKELRESKNLISWNFDFICFTWIFLLHSCCGKVLQEFRWTKKRKLSKGWANLPSRMDSALCKGERTKRRYKNWQVPQKPSVLVPPVASVNRAMQWGGSTFMKSSSSFATFL